MTYSIRLTITHSYNQPAANARHMVRVVPRALEQRQSLITHVTEVTPEPDFRAEALDFFGNTAMTCTHRVAHSQLSIRLTCQIEVLAPEPWLDISPDVQALRHEWGRSTDMGPDSPVHFLGPTRRLAPVDAIAAFARDVVRPGDSVAACVIALGQALHDAMTFDSGATHVDTEAGEAFSLRRGVCQDFSHIMILGLHALGIPAGYVSGYLRTLPPPGAVRLEGADAMHAWVRAWCGVDQGWIEYDPTNATLVGTDHIVVAYGRDYADVPPVAGQLRSSGGQVNSQAVDVALVEQGAP